MNKEELEILKRVLPEPWEVVNEGGVDEPSGVDMTAIWDGDDCQHRLAGHDTARQVLNWIMAKERAWWEAKGRESVKHQLKELLGVRDDINAAVEAAQLRRGR